MLLLLAPALSACGGGGRAAGPTTTAGAATQDRSACPNLLQRLRRVVAALQASSQLIARSRNERQLSRRIGIEQVQLERSARLMSEGPTPAPVAAPVARLAAALRAYARDFAAAKAPAARGDFQAASQALTDPAVARRIAGAATTIQDACR